MAFICFASLLGVVFNVINQQDLEQIYRQTSLLAQSEARLRELSVRDPLTGLYNRRYMQEALERELLRAQQKHLPFSLVMIDMDNLKIINDTFGHSGGDEALNQITRAILKTSRNVDVACRYGGDEFMLILPEMSLDMARKYAEQLRRTVAETRVYCAECLIESVTFSAGVASYPQHGSNAETLLKAADSALYTAKREGRDRVVALEMPISKEFIG
jgi:diguanylate cyclase (GGDEF)-like protein